MSVVCTKARGGASYKAISDFYLLMLRRKNENNNYNNNNNSNINDVGDASNTNHSLGNETFLHSRLLFIHFLSSFILK